MCIKWCSIVVLYGVHSSYIAVYMCAIMCAIMYADSSMWRYSCEDVVHYMCGSVVEMGTIYTGSGNLTSTYVDFYVCNHTYMCTTICYILGRKWCGCVLIMCGCKVIEVEGHPNYSKTTANTMCTGVDISGEDECTCYTMMYSSINMIQMMWRCNWCNWCSWYWCLDEWMKWMELMLKSVRCVLYCYCYCCC